MYECGVTAKLVKEYGKPDITQDYRYERQKSEVPKPYKFEHIFAAVLVLACGNIAGMLTLLLEIILTARKRAATSKTSLEFAHQYYNKYVAENTFIMIQQG